MLKLPGDQLGAAHPLAERLPELRLERTQRDPAVGALIRAVADQRSRQRQIAPARNRPVGEVARRHERKPGQRAVGHRYDHQLPFARALGARAHGARAGRGSVALTQRRQDPERRHQRTAADVGDLARGLHRLTAALAGQSQEADQPQVVHVVPGGIALGTVLAVARDRAVDDARVLRAHALIAHAEAVEHAGTEGLEHDVVLADERQQHFLAALVLQIEPDRALVAVERQEQRRARALVRAVVVGRRPADVVAHAGVLDLQHIGTEVRQQQRAEAAREKPRQIEHADALERKAHRRASTPRGAIASIARASCTVAARRPMSSVICLAFAISSPFERAISPFGRYRLSSSPTRIEPPSVKALETSIHCSREIPITPQWEPSGMLSTIAARLRAVGGMPPVTPITQSTCSGVFSTPMSISGARLPTWPMSKHSCSGLMSSSFIASSSSMISSKGLENTILNTK